MDIRRLKRWLSRRRRSIRSADAARDQGAAALAAARYGDILTRWGPQFSLFMQYGNALKDSGQFAAAEAAYQSAQELQPNEAEVYLQRGHLAKLLGRLDDAHDLYFLAWDIDPGLPGLAAELPRRKLARLRARNQISDPSGGELPFATWLGDAARIDQPLRNAGTYRQAVIQLLSAKAP